MKAKPLLQFAEIPFKHKLWRDGLERHTRGGQVEVMYRYVVPEPKRNLVHIGAVWCFTDWGAASRIRRLFADPDLIRRFMV